MCNKLGHVKATSFKYWKDLLARPRQNMVLKPFLVCFNCSQVVDRDSHLHQRKILYWLLQRVLMLIEPLDNQPENYLSKGRNGVQANIQKNLSKAVKPIYFVEK